MDKPRYRYNWKTGKADRLFMVERPPTEVEGILNHLRSMREAQELMVSYNHFWAGQYDDTIH